MSSLFVVEFHLAILHAPGHADVIRPVEEAHEAIAQCYAWLRGVPVTAVTLPGIVCWLTTEDELTHAHVERHTLELADPAEDWADDPTPATVRTLRCMPRPGVEQEHGEEGA